jgi:tetratricopeptide (TPR) repeat protein
LLSASLILLIILYSAMAISRSTIWRSDEAIWQDAVNKNPKNPVALTTLAQSLLPLGKSEQARTLLQQAIAIEPDRFYPRRMETYALALINTGDYDAATSLVERLQRRMPDSSTLYQLRAMIAARKGDTARAELALKEAIARNSNSLPARVALMNLFIREERNLLDVLRLANEMIVINPDASEGYLYRGVALKNLGETDRAIQAFNQAISRNRRDPEAYFFLANLYEELGERDPAYLQKALSIYGQLLMQNDRNVSAMLNMGLVYAQLGRYAEAKRLWERILEIDPGNASAKHNLQLLREE